MQVKIKAEVLDVLHVVLLVVTSDELEVVPGFLRQVVRIALNLDVGLRLLGALDLDEAGTALLVLRALLLDLVAQPILGGIRWHWNFVHLVHHKRVL